MLGLTKLIQTTKVFALPRLAAFQSANYTKKSIEEKLGLPLKPKRPLTPYFRFLTEIRPKIVHENPKLSLTEVAQAIGKKWREQDDAAKSKFTADYMKEQEAYEKVKARYDSKLTQDQKNEIADARKDLAEKKEKLAHKKKIRDNDKPKKPASGFIRFCSEVFANEKRGETDVNDYRRVIAQRWNELPEEKKKTYNEAFKNDLERYKKELSTWETKMIHLGNDDLVRSEALTPFNKEVKHRPRRSKD